MERPARAYIVRSCCNGGKKKWTEDRDIVELREWDLGVTQGDEGEAERGVQRDQAWQEDPGKRRGERWS